MAASGKLVLIIGPSGVGKSVLLKRLKEQHPELVFPRSATTRQRRPKEGDDLYQFVDDGAFDGLIRDDKLLEWAQVHGGARYGTLKSEILTPIEEGKIVVREVDVQGFESLRAHPLFSGSAPAYPLESIFILPENKEQLVQRIKRRDAAISDDELQRRIRSMDAELAKAELCTAAIRNVEGKLQDTLKEVERIIFA